MQFLLEDLLDQRSYKEAALKRAAEISPLVTSVTIGRDSSFIVEELPEKDSSPTVVEKKTPKTKHAQIVKKSPSLITTADLTAMQRQIYFQNEEKKLKEQVRKRMEERLIHEKIHNERIQKTLQEMQLEAERKEKAKMEELERQIEAALKIEDENEKVYQNQRLELTKNTRKILEQQEKELRDGLKRFDDHFAQLEISFNKITAQCDPEMSQILEIYKKQFEDLKSQKASNRLSLDGLKIVCSKAEEMCHSLMKHCKDFETQSKARKAQKEAEEQQAAENRRIEEERIAAEQAKAELQASKQIVHVAPQKIPSEASPSVPSVGTNQNRPAVASNTGRYYYELMQLVNNKQNSTRQLTEAQELEVIRFALKLAVNNPVNMLNEKNKTTLMEGFQKLHNLLAGQRISTLKGAVAISDHNQAGDWTKLRIAEKLIDACDKKSETTFYIAALTVALWQKFPDFGEIFLAKLFKECPYLVPFRPPKHNGQSDNEFLQSVGYRVDDDRPEQYIHYQSRTSKLAALMAAIWITTSRRDEQAPHPFGIDHGWKYLVNILNSEPDPLHLHIIDKILEISGSTLHQTYGKQFVKMMIALRDLYLPSLRSVDEGMQAAYNRLRQITVANFFKENRFEPPKGKLASRYW